MEDQIAEIRKQALLRNLLMAEMKNPSLQEIECFNVNPMDIKEEELSAENNNLGELDTKIDVIEWKPTFCQICNFEEVTPPPLEDNITEYIKLCCDDCYKNDFIKYNRAWLEQIYNFSKMCNNCTDAFKNGCYIKIHNCCNLFWCKKCSAKFHQQRDLELHYKSCKSKSQYYVCDICCKSFKFLSQLKNHRIIHSNKRPYTCINCSKSFFSLNNLKSHLHIHSGEKPYSCDKCSKSFAYLRNLRSHLRIHADIKPFSCKHCLKSFARFDCLKSHLRIHSGEKPYSCDKCAKSFTQSSNLRSHLRIHTGEKPYSCDKCSKSFAQSTTLKCHLRIHSGEKPYSCDNCSKSFAYSSYLKFHLLRCIGEKPTSSKD